MRRPRNHLTRMRFQSAATLAIVVATLACSTAESARSQGTDWTETWVGSEWELYARALTLRGAIGGEPWSIRPFAPPVTRAWSATAADHPWASRLAASADSAKSFMLLRPSISSSYNSGFAWGMNDGPVWQGRGANAWVTAGFIFRAGPLSIRAEPLFDYGENRAFDLEPTPASASRFADDMRPFTIDQPQRLGDGSVRIVNPGQSYVRLDVRGLAAGFSTEDMFWGPGVRNAILFDANAGGFPHVFLGTTHVVKTPIGGFSAQLVYGRLGESSWAPRSSSTARFGAGAIAVLTPAPTIEVGVARFYHREWTGQFGGSEIAAPFGSFFKIGIRVL